MVSEPLADGCTPSLLQILKGNEGEIIRSYLHSSHITGPTRPISTIPPPQSDCEKIRVEIRNPQVERNDWESMWWVLGGPGGDGEIISYYERLRASIYNTCHLYHSDSSDSSDEYIKSWLKYLEILQIFLGRKHFDGLNNWIMSFLNIQWSRNYRKY